jgi:CRP/FNR family transcriptional regulator, dissimilatory nitrate respiration regulator
MNQELMQMMRGTPLLSALNEAELRRLAEVSRRRKLSRKEALFLEGDPVDGFYLVLAGAVRLFKISADGSELTLHIAQRGQTFAEAAMFTPRGFPANAEAVDAAEVLFLPREEFVAMLRDGDELCLRLFRDLAIWIRRLTDIIFSLAFRDVESRLISYLIQQFRDESGRLSNGQELHLDVEKSLLASYLGTTPETFSRVLRKLQDNGLLNVDGPRLTVIDAEALHEIVELDE